MCVYPSVSTLRLTAGASSAPSPSGQTSGAASPPAFPLSRRRRKTKPRTAMGGQAPGPCQSVAAVLRSRPRRRSVHCAAGAPFHRCGHGSGLRVVVTSVKTVESVQRDTRLLPMAAKSNQMPSRVRFRRPEPSNLPCRTKQQFTLDPKAARTRYQHWLILVREFVGLGSIRRS